MNWRIADFHEAYRGGSLTPSAIVEACLARAEAADPALFIRLTRSRAVQEARCSTLRWADGRSLGPLDGIPLVWKDLFDMAGTPTTAASRWLAEAPAATADAPAVAALCRAGAVSIGKVNLSEFAYSGLGLNPHFGTPKNPLSPEVARAPGGSSSGSAVAVSAGLVPVGMGTDTGGSLRVPAAFQGLVGYQPSVQRHDKSGVYPLSISLDSIGPMAHCVQDCITVDAALRGRAAWGEDLVAAAAPDRLHFLVPANVVFDEAEPAVRPLFDSAVQALRTAGARVDIEPVPVFEQIVEQSARHGTLAAAEACHWHRERVDGPHAERFDRRVLARLLRGRAMSAHDLLTIQQARSAWRAAFSAQLANRVLLMPTVVHVAPEVAALEADDERFHRVNGLTLRNTMLGNFLGLCGMSLPMGLGRDGMPLGALLQCDSGADASLFAAALAVEPLLNRPHTGV